MTKTPKAKAPKKAVKKTPKKQAAPVADQVGKPGPEQITKQATKRVAKLSGKRTRPAAGLSPTPLQPAALAQLASTGEVLDRLHDVIQSRRDVDPTLSHSARLLSRGPAKVAQKFGEEAVEALIEAVAGNKPALISESADVLYHLLVLWVASGVAPQEVWAELHRREGVSGVAEKASRALKLPGRLGTTKIP